MKRKKTKKRKKNNLVKEQAVKRVNKRIKVIHKSLCMLFPLVDPDSVDFSVSRVIELGVAVHEDNIVRIYCQAYEALNNLILEEISNLKKCSRGKKTKKK